ncbi:MAG: hypothetical protein J6R32_05665 [Bacteroidales bacterium]|nr:hypothetical protein [Bacteroidales bacterium]
MKIRTCLIISMICLLFASCSAPTNLAYDFVRKSKGAEVAFYVPYQLDKINIRKDCQGEFLDSIAPEDINDTINARTKIVNKIDDEKFFNIMISSFESTLNDYNLKLSYWENENTKPDSLHWVVDLSHMEVIEFIEYILTTCGYDSYEFIPSTSVNVDSWFELINNDKQTSNLLYTEQSYVEYVEDCNYHYDTLNNVTVTADIQRLTIDGFYDFAVMLGKLYAGYSFDYFMNEYVKKEMARRGKEYSEDRYMRYDPYEFYIYNTRRDKLIGIEE